MSNQGNLARIARLTREVRYAFRKFPVTKFDLTREAEAARFFDEHGWVIFQRVFTVAEVDAFRADVLASKRDGREGELLSDPRLRRFLLDDRTLRIARALLGGEPTYFGDSTATADRTVPSTLGFHKDNPDKLNERAPDWGPQRFPVLRMALYLQDHVQHSGGLGLRDRSHRTIDTSVGDPFAAPTAKGDVVVWSLRTSHTGFASRPHVFPDAFLPMGVQARLTMRARGALDRPRLLFRALERPERMAMFASFGTDGPLLRRFIRYLKTRRYAVMAWKNSEYTDDLRAEAVRKGLRVIDTPAEVRGIDPMSVPEEHHELPPEL
jgi:hypothetical protein